MKPSIGTEIPYHLVGVGENDCLDNGHDLYLVLAHDEFYVGCFETTVTAWGNRVWWFTPSGGEDNIIAMESITTVWPFYTDEDELIQT